MRVHRSRPKRQTAWGARPDWRTYQANLKRKKSGKPHRWMMTGGLMCLLAGIAAYGITDDAGGNATYLSTSSRTPIPEKIRPDVRATPPAEEKVVETEPAPIPRTEPSEPSAASPQRIGKVDVQAILKNEPFINRMEPNFDYRFDGRRFRIHTSLDPDLQQYLMQRMDRDHSRYIGIIVMDPRTGRVLGMAGYDRDDPLHNPCTDSSFPAASVFKIVTAAAAIEKCGFGSDSTVSFSGKKHTLYKNQILKEPKGWVSRLSLRDSFAQSVNPVFGKLGAHFVGKTGLEEYAEAFGFNRPINFDLPVTPSRVSISDGAPYQWAEIASGFNRQTTLSPLHGAVMVSAIVTGGGNLIEPTIVDRIGNEKGEILYSFEPAYLSQAISQDSAAVMKMLMRETIDSGTCRKTFRGYPKHPLLSQLVIGGKTGSINSQTHEGRRFDWFVGFAEERNGSEQIVISIVVAHEKFIGVRSQEYGRMAIEEHFRKYFIEKNYAGKHPSRKEKS